MATWPYPPQLVLTETLVAPTRRSSSAPRTINVGGIAADLQRSFRLRYTAIDSAECSGMADFFLARRGGFEAFTFVNPNDQFPYAVRFATDLTLDFFTPALFRAGGELVFMVVSG
jgi:hypothetical protein